MPIDNNNNLHITGEQITIEGQQEFMIGRVPLNEETWSFTTFPLDEISLGRDLSLLPNGDLLVYGGKGTDNERLMFLARFNSQDSLLWERTIPDEDSWWENGGNMEVLPNGEVIIVSHTYEPGESYDAGTGITKTDSLGEVIWQREVGNTSFGWACGIKKVRATPDGGYVVLGCFDGDDTIFWLNSFGTTTWKRVFDFPGKTVHQIKVAANGDILGCGKNNNVSWPELSGPAGGWLFRFNPEGTLLWERNYMPDPPYPNYHHFMDITETPDGHLALTGKRVEISPDGSGNVNTWLLVTDENGCLEEGCGTDILLSDNEAGPTATEVAPWFSCYPIPADERLVVQLRQQVAQGQFRLYSALGQPVLAEAVGYGTQQLELDVSALPPAMYVLRLEVEGKVMQVEKVLVR